MAAIHANGVDLHYEVEGDGPPLVLVHDHGSDHLTWDRVAPALTASFRVLRYDRRGHGRSGSGVGAADRRRHEDDLAALVERVHDGPAYVAGDAFGGSVSLGLAARRPELVRALTAHQPPVATDLDLDALASYAGPLLISQGSSAPPLLRHSVDRLGERVPSAATASVIGAGHAPHRSHPHAYAQLVTTFLGNAAANDLTAAIRS
jgi:pimeloyl-ACP methyl ester carboxylesterase